MRSLSRSTKNLCQKGLDLFSFEMIRQVPDITPLAALAARLESSQEQRFAAIAALRSKLGAKCVLHAKLLCS